MKYIVVFLLVLSSFIQVGLANPYANHFGRMLDAFCIDPIEDDFEELDRAVKACFEDTYQDRKYQCIEQSVSAAWFFQKLTKDPDSIEDKMAFDISVADAKANCIDDIVYRQIVQECIQIAEKNKVLIQALYLFNGECVDFADLARIKSEVSLMTILLKDVVSAFKKDLHQIAFKK
ncbi:MAG: hypothetical protein KDD46_07810 [Bdellovibrionales bacterium]|nr:hypothetical protein [Bdellovibrionales bacterium]